MLTDCLREAAQLVMCGTAGKCPFVGALGPKSRFSQCVKDPLMQRQVRIPSVRLWSHVTVLVFERKQGHRLIHVNECGAENQLQ